MFVREQEHLLEEEELLNLLPARISVVLVFFSQSLDASNRADCDTRGCHKAATLNAEIGEIGNFGKAHEWIETAARWALICGRGDH